MVGGGGDEQRDVDLHRIDTAHHVAHQHDNHLLLSPPNVRVHSQLPWFPRKYDVENGTSC